MAEPLTLAAVSAVVLAEGIKFLYGQAGEALKRWHERRKAPPDRQQQTFTLSSPLPAAIFDGHLAPLTLHFTAFDDESETMLRSLRRDLADYAEGWKPIAPNDRQLLKAVDALRKVMEAIYQQRLTFAGESRSASGPVIRGEINVHEIIGDAAVVRAEAITSGWIEGTVKVDRVSEGGKVAVIDAGTIGGTKKLT